MSDDHASDGALSAITSEHFVMQGAISTSVNEQQARASMFLYSVSGSLVAIGFMAQSDHRIVLIISILSGLFIVGLLTTLRLVDISMESMQAHVTVARIHKHYRSLGQVEHKIFDPAHGRWPEGKTDSGQIIGPFLGLMTTAASMIACVNGMILAALAAMIMNQSFRLSLGVAISAGCTLAVTLVAIFFFYQKWRIFAVGQFATEAGLEISDDSNS